MQDCILIQLFAGFLGIDYHLKLKIKSGTELKKNVWIEVVGNLYKLAICVFFFSVCPNLFFLICQDTDDIYVCLESWKDRSQISFLFLSQLSGRNICAKEGAVPWEYHCTGGTGMDNHNPRQCQTATIQAVPHMTKRPYHSVEPFWWNSKIAADFENRLFSGNIQAHLKNHLVKVERAW